MATKTKTNTEETETQAPNTSLNLETVKAKFDEGADVELYNPNPKLGSVIGEVTRDDFLTPRIKIVYGVGEGAINFNPGEITFEYETKIANKGQPLTVIVLSARKFYRELLPYIPGLKSDARAYDTLEEAMVDGLTSQWTRNAEGKTIPATVGPCLSMNLLVKQPENTPELNTFFPITVAGEQYAAARFTVDKSAYNRVGRTLLTAQLALPEQNLLNAVWTLWTSAETINDNVTVVPKIKLQAPVSPEAKADILKFFNR